MRLQVLICTYGAEGMQRLLEHAHPRTPGVEWRVSWQLPGEDISVLPALMQREDFTVIKTTDRGLSRNRNNALNNASNAPYILLADDDTNYTAEALTELLNAFEKHKEAEVIMCRSTVDGKIVKNYGEGSFDLRNPPKGWYATSFEMAFRKKAAEGVKFCENAGVGAPKIIAGEENIFLHKLLKKGRKGIGIALTICNHTGPTTSERLLQSKQYHFTQGAVISYLKPLSWPLRLPLYALRSPANTLTALYHAYRGAIYALTHRPFRG